MRKITIATLAALAVGLSLAAAPVLHAQGTQIQSGAPTGAPQSQMGSGMMGGDMGGMMSRMDQMMEACNKMMQGMGHQSPSPADPGSKG